MSARNSTGNRTFLGDDMKTVVLQFENVVGMIERLRDAGQAHRLDAGEHR
jgi:hypothetical protein